MEGGLKSLPLSEANSPLSHAYGVHATTGCVMRNRSPPPLKARIGRKSEQFSHYSFRIQKGGERLYPKIRYPKEKTPGSRAYTRSRSLWRGSTGGLFIARGRVTASLPCPFGLFPARSCDARARLRGRSFLARCVSQTLPDCPEWS